MILSPSRASFALAALCLPVLMTHGASAQCLHDEHVLLQPSQASSSDGVVSDVAVHGTWAAIGSAGDRKVTLFEFVEPDWIERQVLGDPSAGGSGFGRSIDLDGEWLVVGEHHAFADQGAVHLYRRTSGQWSHAQTLKDPQGPGVAELGNSVAIRGEVVAAGSYAEGVFAFRFDGSSWSFEERLGSPDGGLGSGFGQQVDTDGERILTSLHGHPSAGLTQAGAAVVYRFNGILWALEQRVEAPDPTTRKLLGSSVTVDGPWMALGAVGDFQAGSEAGAVYLFQHVVRPWGWEFRKKLTGPAAQAHFGHRVSLRGERLLVGADDGMRNQVSQGRAFAVHRVGSDWKLGVELIRSIPGTDGDRLGAEVDQDGDWSFVAAAAGDWSGKEGMASATRISRLSVDVRPDAPAAGDPMLMEACKGLPGGLAIAVLIRFDGVTGFTKLLWGQFDATGRWAVNSTLPPGLSGHEAWIAVYGFADSTGQVEEGAPDVVRFQ